MADHNPIPGGVFHRFSGLDVELSERNTVASIGGKRVFYHARGSDQDGGYQMPRPVINMRRVVFSSEPIEITGTFQVHVTRRKCKAGDTRIEFFPEDNRGTICNPHQSMALGFIAYDPMKLLVIPCDNGIGESWHYSSDVWMLSEDNAYHDGKKETKHNLCIFYPDSNTIGCRVNEKGYLEFIMDGKNHGVVWSKPLPMDRPLWGFVDLPIEYKIRACSVQGRGLPPSYEASVEEGDRNPVTLSDFKDRIAKLETAVQANKQEIRLMQQELTSSFQRQLDEQSAHLEELIRQQFETHLTLLPSHTHKTSPNSEVTDGI